MLARFFDANVLLNILLSTLMILLLTIIACEMLIASLTHFVLVEAVPLPKTKRARS